MADDRIVDRGHQRDEVLTRLTKCVYKSGFAFASKCCGLHIANRWNVGYSFHSG